MNRYRILPLLVLALLIPIASVRADEIDRLVAQGMDQIYAVQFDAAARSFDQAIAADRNDPRGYFFRANVHLWSYLFDKRQTQLDLFFSMSDKTIAVAEQRLRGNGNDSRARLILGMAYGYKTIANARAENFMAAALSARTCYDQLNDLVQDDPHAYDAYLGLGLFHFLFGSVPKAGQFLANLNGIKGDARLGMREIETAAQRGTYFKTDAQLIVALLDIYYLDDLNRGLGVLEGLAKRYPRNVAMLYAIGTALSAQNQADRAIPYFERVAEQGNNDFKVVTDLSLARCGAAYLARNDVARAKPYLQRFLKSTTDKLWRAYGWYLLGLAFDLEGNHANAVKAYAYVAQAPGLSPEDRMARRRAALLAKNPMTQTDIAIQRALNAIGASHYDEIVAGVGSILGRRDLTPAQRAQAFYAYGEALRGKGQYARAIDAFKSAVAAGRHSETWVAPFSYLHIAECYQKLGDREKSRANLDLAKDYSGYDNEPQLRFQIERDVTLID
ncbi:MAG: tetratricopeptide repeat protein [Bacteroidetes bacterium]|nr:tetratricopeptide repeat protein [Bacteroidota bacterium]